MIAKKSKIIALVDDSDDIAGVVTLILQSAGYQVLRFSDGQCFAAIKKLAQKPDLILLDVLLSGADGRLLCQEFKKDKTTRHIPIVMVSAYPHVKTSALAAGADNFLSKPFDRQKLLATINVQLHKKR